MLWAKGYTELLDRMKEHTQRTGQNVPVDVFGSGPDLKVGSSVGIVEYLYLYMMYPLPQTSPHFPVPKSCGERASP